MKINIGPDCGNSPKRAFIKDFNLAFAQADVQFILEHVTEDVIWEIYGDKRIEGKASFEVELRSMASHSADELTIQHIITHGNEAACNGLLVMDGKRYAFSDVYIFISAGKQVIKRIYSYVVGVN